MCHPISGIGVLVAYFVAVAFFVLCCMVPFPLGQVMSYPALVAFRYLQVEGTNKPLAELIFMVVFGGAVPSTILGVIAACVYECRRSGKQKKP